MSYENGSMRAVVIAAIVVGLMVGVLVGLITGMALYIATTHTQT